MLTFYDPLPYDPFLFVVLLAALFVPLCLLQVVLWWFDYLEKKRDAEFRAAQLVAEAQAQTFVRELNTRG